MFDSFHDRKPSWHPAVVVVIVIAVALVGLGWCAKEHERQQIAQMNNVMAGAFAMTAPTPRELSPLALPGMVIDAPGPAQVRGDYMNGSTIQDLSATWGVTWQRGPLPSAEVLRSIATSTMAEPQRMQIGASRSLEISGERGQQFELVNELGVAVVVTFTECDHRIVEIVTGTVNARDDNAKMVASFRCTPDPAAARSTDGADVVVDVRPGWTRTASTGQLMLVNERGVLVQPRMTPNVADLPLETLIPAGIRSERKMTMSGGPKQLQGRKVWFGTIETGGTKQPFAIVAWPCPGTQGIATVYVFTLRDAPLDKGIDLALTGRCLAPGEHAPAYPASREKPPRRRP